MLFNTEDLCKHLQFRVNNTLPVTGAFWIMWRILAGNNSVFLQGKSWLKEDQIWFLQRIPSETLVQVSKHRERSRAKCGEACERGRKAPGVGSWDWRKSKKDH